MDPQEKQEKILKLRGQIAACTRCSLHKTRTNTVPGEGDVNAQIMFIGEAPGRNEDLQGKPFVGRAGDVFDKLLGSVGLTRDQIYLCNILKCRPPENRNPLSSEISACVGSLDLQIKIVNPKVICTMGNFATTYIFDKFQLPPSKISAVAGRVFDVDTLFGSLKIVPLFHPAVATYDVNKISLLVSQFQVLRPFCSVDNRVCSEKTA
jgi:DNA polymerase